MEEAAGIEFGLENANQHYIGVQKLARICSLHLHYMPFSAEVSMCSVCI
jgi:hypothetical protein